MKTRASSGISFAYVGNFVSVDQFVCYAHTVTIGIGSFGSCGLLFPRLKIRGGDARKDAREQRVAFAFVRNYVLVYPILC